MQHRKVLSNKCGYDLAFCLPERDILKCNQDQMCFFFNSESHNILKYHLIKKTTNVIVIKKKVKRVCESV